MPFCNEMLMHDALLSDIPANATQDDILGNTFNIYRGGYRDSIDERCDASFIESFSSLQPMFTCMAEKLNFIW